MFIELYKIKIPIDQNKNLINTIIHELLIINICLISSKRADLDKCQFKVQ